MTTDRALLWTDGRYFLQVGVDRFCLVMMGFVWKAMWCEVPLLPCITSAGQPGARSRVDAHEGRLARLP